MNIALISLIPIYMIFVMGLAVYMFKVRVAAAKRKEVEFKHFKAYQGEAPYELEVIKNNFENQFQVPLVFFITCVAFTQYHEADLLTVILGAAFIISRFIHSYIHLGSNNVILRAQSYGWGVLIILGIWIQFFIKNFF